jgi:alkaline phosphatase D
MITIHRMRKLIVAALLLATLSGIATSQQPTSRSGSRTALRSGPMLGYADLTEASVWVQTTGNSEVRLRYWPEGKRGESRTTAALVADEKNDRIALFVLPDLDPGTRYGYEILIGGGPAAFPAGGTSGTFDTQTFWQYRANPPDFTVAFGSCYYANEPKMDRPGTPYGSDPRIFRTIAGMKPDLMLWLGDNVYLREPDFGSVAAMKRRNALAREEPALQPLLGIAHHYATWDDHDFGPNNSIWLNRFAAESLDIFKRYWANPTYGMRDIPGVFGQFSWGDIDFFLLDDRFYRTPEGLPEAADKTMLGREQLRWIQHALYYSRAPFKVVVNGSQVLNSTTRDETFAHYPDQKELVDFIVRHRIRGVLFLSGDRHETELLRVTPEGFYTLYDFTSSPLTAGLTNPMPKGEENNPLRVPGTLVNDMHSFGLLRFSGKCNERTLEMQVVDREGKVRWTHTIKASDLVPPPAPGTTPGPYRGHSACAFLKQ